MLRARDIMTKELITVSPKTEITKAAKILLEKGINGIPVVDSGRLVGILCQSDLIAQQKKLPIPSVFTLLDGFIPLRSAKHFEKAFKKIAATTVADSMTPDPVTVQPETSIEEIASSYGGQESSHPSRGGREKACRDCRQRGCLKDPDVER